MLKKVYIFVTIKYILSIIGIITLCVFVGQCSLTHKYYYQNTQKKYNKQLKYIYSDYRYVSESKNIETDNLEYDYSNIMEIYYKEYKIYTTNSFYIYNNIDNFYDQVRNNIQDYINDKCKQDSITFCVSKPLNKDSSYNDFVDVYGNINFYKKDLSNYFKNSKCYLEFSGTRDECDNILKVFPDANLVYTKGNNVIYYKLGKEISNIDNINDYLNILC